MRDLLDPIEYRGTTYRIVKPNFLGIESTEQYTVDQKLLRGNPKVAVKEEGVDHAKGSGPTDDMALILFGLEHLLYGNVKVDEACEYII